MDANSQRQDDLTDIERRLSAWRPNTEGLSREAMLFAAGVADGSLRRGRWLWPTLCAGLAVTTVALGTWVYSEHSELQLLLSRIQRVDERPLHSSAPSIDAPATAREFATLTSSNSYFNLRKHFEQDPAHWLASTESTGPVPLGPAPPEPAILRASQYDVLLSQ
jgi:hypothetical protein